MKNYGIHIQYDGTRYSGWQKQGNTQNTIQGKIETVLEKMTDSEIEIHGSGRTDAGVHALQQVANFKCDTPKTPDQIMEYLNMYLPLDIRITSIWEAAPRFHARLNATKKHYRYIIDTNPYQDVFTRKYATHLPGNYDLHAMKEAAALLTREHDFKSFCENKHMKKSTVRTIYEISFSFENGILTIDFFGNGFLYHMVRILTGTLLEVGTHEKNPKETDTILQAKDRLSAGFTAPPQGLFLVEVFYQ